MSFVAQGIFNDGGTFSGTFAFDPQQLPSPPNPPTSFFIDSFNIISTHGSVFNGFTYLSGNVSTGADGGVTPPSCGAIQFSFQVVPGSQLVLAVPGGSFATFSGGPIVNTCPVSPSGVISFEQLSPPTGVLRSVTSGQVAPIPEPAPSGLVLTCLIVGEIVRFCPRGASCLRGQG
jgi:hypothetical protein